MKLLVPAAYAQFGVGAGRRCGSPRICGGGAPSNGMEDPTLRSWRPAVVHRRTPFVVSDLCTKQIANLHRGATRLYAVNAVCRVACLAWAGWMGESTRHVPGQGRSAISLKPCLQKRIRDGLTVVEIT